ncbi:MAG TPA: TetR/AcrR family transcriptional regulator [Acidimicrobiales bacterium]|nr:TetR/AcrR family transcriptional regulator [Acidimicrobiales bacterium]
MTISGGRAERTVEGGDRHGGRHLDASRDAALRDAALRLLAQIGYDRLTVDAIATSAGAGKATIYRRWSGKAELVVDALLSHKPHLEAPDTGSLRGDLRELALRASAHTGEPLDSSVMVGLASALPRDPDLRAAFEERLVEPHRRVLATVFERAVARGEIAPVANVDLVVSLIPALVLYRLLVQTQEIDPAFIQSIIEGVILPLVLAGPVSLQSTPTH